MTITKNNGNVYLTPPIISNQDYHPSSVYCSVHCWRWPINVCTQWLLFFLSSQCFPTFLLFHGHIPSRSPLAIHLHNWSKNSPPGVEQTPSHYNQLPSMISEHFISNGKLKRLLPWINIGACTPIWPNFHFGRKGFANCLQSICVFQMVMKIQKVSYRH